MIIALVVTFVLAWAFLFYLYRDVFSPWSVTLGVWSVILFMYLTLNHELYAVSDQFVICLILWVVGLVSTSFLTFRFMPVRKVVVWQPCETNINILTAISALLVPYMCYKTVMFALSNGSVVELVYNIRLQTVDDSYGFSLGPVRYFVFVVYVLLLVELDRKKINRWRLALVFFMGLMFFFCTMAKVVFFMLFLSSFYMLYTRGRISLKPIAIASVVFFFFGFVLTNVRTFVSDSGVEEGMTVMDFIGMYLLAPIVAFGYDTANSAMLWGENTFRGYYVIANALGWTSVKPMVFQDFVPCPVPINVATAMSPYFKDFGYVGVLIFGIIVGFVTGATYKLAQSGQNIMKMLYAYFLITLALQFFDELLFVGLSSLFQIIAVLIFCFVKISFREDSSSNSAV